MAQDICIIGLGGGGAKILDGIADAVAGGAAVVAVNTDTQALAESRAPSRVQIGMGRTHGFGTGGDVALGRQALEDDREVVEGLFGEVRLLILLVGLGGGTGTGAAPALLNIARDAGVMTLCFATMPFSFEGRLRRDQAYRGLAEIRDAADAVVMVQNDRLAEFVGESKVNETFARVDAVVGDAVCAVWKMLAKPGFINLDFADLRKVVKNTRGICALGYGRAEGENRAFTAVTSLLDGPLTDHGQVVANADSLLVSIVGGPDLTLVEVGAIMDAISARARKDGRIFMGTVIDEEWVDRVTITVIASEEWAPPDGETAQEEGPAESEGTASAKRGGGKRSRKRHLQTKLRLDASSRGRFKDVEPTVMDGEDLDIPTFARRGISIEK